MLEAGLWLHKAGLRGVGVSTREAEARWKILRKRLEQEHDDLERKWKLKSRCGKLKNNFYLFRAEFACRTI